jgi:uncharacterized protein (TIGR04255 family)
MLDLTKIERPKDLPQWATPPLDEVALSVQFNDIPGLKVAHYGLLTERLRPLGLVITEDKPPINASFEVFGKRMPPPVQIQFQAVEVPMPRVWYLSEDKRRLAQVQPDRFVYNWRKVKGAGVYPRLNTVLPEFWRAFETFQEFLKDNALPDPAINQCELSYFNNIDVYEDETYEDAFSRVFRVWTGGIMPESLKNAYLEPDAGNFTRTYILRLSDDSPVARIHVIGVAGMRQTDRVIRLTFVFRGPWSGPAESALAEFMALGREAIVRLFDSMISDQMHAEWGRHVGGLS